MLSKLTTTVSDAWSWWWQSMNVNNHQDCLLVSLTFFLLLTCFSWWLLMLIFNKSNNQTPPLPPGPRALPIVGNLLSLEPDLHTYFSTLAQTFGPIITLRLGKKVGIVVTSPAVAREILKDHDAIFANRDVPVAAKEATYGGCDIAWTPYDPEWRMLRKVCVREMLSSATLDSMYTLRRKEIRDTIGYIYGRAGLPVNVGEQMFLTALNVITNMLWGGTVKGKERAGLGREFRQLVAEMTELMGMPNVSDFYPSLARFDLQGIRKKMNGLAKRFDKIFEGIIDQRLQMNENDSKDFLQFLLQLKDRGGDAKMPFTMIHLKALLMDMVVGGTDTSSNTVEFSMAEMMNKPYVMQKAQQELETIVGKDNIVEECHIHKLPYLQAIMKETLRLHPGLPLMVPHCPGESCVVAGYTIPKGARVFFNIWAIHRDPMVWERPTEFIPERFLNSEVDYGGNDFNYFPFGSGRRICAGIAMAERMVLFLLASLIHSFDWKLTAGEKLDISEKFGIVLKKKVPLVAIPTPRSCDPTLYK